MDEELGQTIRPLLAECGRPQDFHGYLEGVRTAHKPKRNLMKLMDRPQTSEAAFHSEAGHLSPSVRWRSRTSIRSLRSVSRWR